MPLRKIADYLDRCLTSAILTPTRQGRMAGFAGPWSRTRDRLGRGADAPTAGAAPARREGGPA